MKAKTKCIIWIGAANNKGYGVIRRQGKNWLAHRLAFNQSHPRMDISSKLVMHKCDVRRCVNPDHLRAGTAKENTADMIRKGRARFPCGEKSGATKFKWREIKEIRRRYISGRKGNLKVLYTEFAMSKTAMLNIVKGRSWKRRK